MWILKISCVFWSSIKLIPPCSFGENYMFTLIVSLRPEE